MKISFIILSLFFLIVIYFASQRIQQLITQGAGPASLPIKALSVTGSKLGIFLINASDGGRKIIMAGPKVIKVMDPQNNSSLMDLVRLYKSNYPDGIVLMRVYQGQEDLHYSTADDPQASAQDFWNKALQPAVNKLSPNDRLLIDYLCGPNENENTPALETEANISWVNSFWMKLAELISAGGFKPCLGEIPVGNLDPAMMGLLVPALQKIKETRGVWTYHAYSDEYTTDDNTESWYSLRYRRFYEYLSQNNPELADLPMVLTEGGIDYKGNAQTDGWNGTIPPRGDAELFKNWLLWFDEQIKRDPYIIGVTLFQIGDDGWKSFNLEPIAAWIAGYLGGTPSEISPTGTSFPPPALSRPPLTLTPANNPTSALNPSVTPNPVNPSISAPTLPPVTLTPAPVLPTLTPLPTLCIPNWCFVQKSQCCFDPICIVMGSVTNDPTARCGVPGNYTDNTGKSPRQVLFEELMNLFRTFF